MIKEFFMKKLNISRTIIILMVIVNFLVIGLYYTYSIFVIKQLKDDISLITVKNNVLVMNIDNHSDNRILVKANTMEELNIYLYNPSEKSMYYRIMHNGVPTGVAVYEKNGDNTSWGEIFSNDERFSSILVNNTTNSDVTIEFLLQESIAKEFDKDISTSYINNKMNFDHSGASKPIFPNNMMPVYYDDTSKTEGVWRKADVNNNTANHIWYDYDNFQWANVVTVSEDNRSKYINSPVGTEIDINDINAFFVWIPKYKYFVISGDGNNSYERLINVNFVNREDIDKVGSVTCIESISNKEDSHLYSEICNDNIYGDIQNNLSTYLHPAFDENLGGFWIGKFANPNRNSYVIKADSSTDLGVEFTNSMVRKMIAPGNIYGFVQNRSFVYNDLNWSYKNANNHLDAHPINSMEWGALAILANSSYGKSGNPMYYNESVKGFTRIYNNASINYSGRSTNYTSSSTSISNSSTNIVSWNDLTDLTHTKNSVTYPIGYKGAGSSTTGTIYGVYDMAGGNNTFVMGIFMNEDGTSPYEISSDYYTAYSFSPYKGLIDGNDKSVYLDVFRLGDGIKEHVRTYTKSGMWQDGSLTINNTGLMLRGGFSINGSIFTAEITSDVNTYETFTILEYKP